MLLTLSTILYVSIKTKIMVGMIMFIFTIYFFSGLYTILGWTLIPNLRRLKRSKRIMYVFIVSFILLISATVFTMASADKLY